MPARRDIRTILVIGSGPIVIGQACEFDYAGTQACKALREEGYRVILVNSNPATIMTDPEFADRTYIEPITPEIVEEIIRVERPDALLPTLGGQTALNVASELHTRGVLSACGVEMIGASPEAIEKAESRERFRATMIEHGLEVPRSRTARSPQEARDILREIGLPCVIRPSFTLGGTGAGMAYNVVEFERMVESGLGASRTQQVLIEESVYGWKEFELEVMRDRKGQVVIVCSIENFDPMGVHTGDSITVAPAQTLTDKETQKMRDAAIRIMGAIGVETGGSNIQFAVNPENGCMVVIEMNPRVSRSSALASKATGFPIAKIAAKLAVGYTLDELPNDITRKTPACFEPSIDYCVVKIPRWTFEKFPDADSTLTIQMKSVGETMSIGRTFREALQKAIRSLEISRAGLGLYRGDRLEPQGTSAPPAFADPSAPLRSDGRPFDSASFAFAQDRQGRQGPPDRDEICRKLSQPNPERLFYLRYAFHANFDLAEVYALTRIDPWFLEQIRLLVKTEKELADHLADWRTEPEILWKAKEHGFSDEQLSRLWSVPEEEIRRRRKEFGVEPTYRLVDTCSGEFEASTPYYYSCYERPFAPAAGAAKASRLEIRPPKHPRVIILGGGPNRIGQGIEFDYCCVQAAFALREAGYEAVMINSNPETVSTDYDTSDHLFFEPLTAEDVRNVCDAIQPYGVIVQLGGQTPLNLARKLEAAGIPILGTSPTNTDIAEDRGKFSDCLRRLGLSQPASLTARNVPEALLAADQLGYPVLLRPSYVLGGRAMEIVYEPASLERTLGLAVEASPEHPVLIDKFLEDAIEVDVDAVADGETVWVAGILEHIEEAGVHSGDATMTLPPYSLSDRQMEKLQQATGLLARELGVVGLMNVQFALKNEELYVLEVNPRASRTVPFVGKALGVPVARLAALVLVGRKLPDLLPKHPAMPAHFSVKESVFPFLKFPGVDILLGPEMRSTGEVMGIDYDLGVAFAKARLAAGTPLPSSGNAFLSVRDSDKRELIAVGKRLQQLGFQIYATRGTGRVLERNQVPVRYLNKLSEGRPHALDMIINAQLALIINTPSGKGPKSDEALIRRTAVVRSVPVITTLPGAHALVNAIEAIRQRPLEVRALQEYHPSGARPGSRKDLKVAVGP